MIRITYLLVALATLLPPAPAAAQNPADILNTAAARWEAQMQGVENYTMVMRTAGVEVQAYFERTMVDGRLAFEARDIQATGMTLPPEALAEWDNPDPYAGLAAMAEQARYQGTETIDGFTTHVLAFDDVSALPGATPPGAEAEIELGSGQIYIDAEEYVVRQMVMEGVANYDGRPQQVTTEVRSEDYRDVQGVTFPFRTVIRVTGLTHPGASLDPEELESAIAMLEAQAAMVPPEERGAMEAMIDQSRRMLAGEPMEMTTEVLELRVNEGPPASQ